MCSWSEQRVRWELASTFNIAPAEIIFVIKAGAYVLGATPNATRTGREVVYTSFP